jgi:hypothetical protein
MTDYESAKLKQGRLSFIIDGLGFLITTVSVIFLALQVSEDVKATHIQAKATEAQHAAIVAQYHSLNASIYQDLMTKQLELNKLLVEHPLVYSYLFGKDKFFTGKPRPEVIAAADYHLDFFQLLYSQRTRLPDLREEDGDWVSWRNTIASAFRESPYLCNRLNAIRHMYAKDFVADVFVRSQWCRDKQRTQ